MPLTPEESKKYMRYAITSAALLALPGVLLKDSSIVILFASKLGAGDSLSLATTSFNSIFYCFFGVLFAYYAMFVGYKKTNISSHVLGLLTFLLAASSPWFGSAGKYILIFSLIAYSISRILHVSSWFPILDQIVPEDQRGRFFGRMRSTWQLVSAVFLIISGFIVGDNASLSTLQIILFLSCIPLLGTIFFMNKIQIQEPEVKDRINLKQLISDVLSNQKLVGFSIYLFCLYAASSATVPVCFMFAKNYLSLGDNIVVIMSAVQMIGFILGYVLGGKLIDRYGTKTAFLIAHIAFGLLNFLLLSVQGDSTFEVVILQLIIGLYGLMFAFASIAVSSEMLSLSPDNNKSVSIAFSWSLYMAGIGFSRFFVSIILESGLLAPVWKVGGVEFTQYHSIFIFSGILVLLASILLVMVPALIKGVRRLPAI
jgi:MFS family permease